MDNIGLIVVTLLAVMFVTPFLYMHISARRAVGKAVPIADLFTASQESPDSIIYTYFMSKNCSMCESMTPIIEKLKSENSNVIIIDINQDPALAKKFHVYGTPTLMTIHAGIIKKVKLGQLSRKNIEKFMSD
ncbi:MAG: thioredoxin family protein [Gammaproteobacteria bacterium]|nr:thioredoxin family protein [Gammaproteobacteria bacterium]